MKGGNTVFVGSSCIDEYYEMKEVPALGEKVNCIAKESVVGGMIGNAAAVHASYGAETYCIDHLNHSTQSETIISDMKKSGINISTIQRVDTLPDPKCLIMLHGGERIIFIVANFKKDLELNQVQHSVLQGAKFVYSSINEMIAFKNCMEIIEEFKQKGAKLVFDLEEGTFPEGEVANKILEKSNLLFINSGGARKLKNRKGENYIQQLTERGCIAVLTKGADGCEVHAPGVAAITVPGFKVNVIDTTGAGDTFNASFLYGLGQDWTLEETAHFANAAAARSIQYMGPRSGAVGYNSVKKFMLDAEKF